MVPDPGPNWPGPQAGATPASPLFWDRRYQKASNRWDLGQPAQRLQEFPSRHPLAPYPLRRPKQDLPEQNRPNQGG